MTTQEWIFLAAFCAFMFLILYTRIAFDIRDALAARRKKRLQAERELRDLKQQVAEIERRIAEKRATSSDIARYERGFKARQNMPTLRQGLADLLDGCTQLLERVKDRRIDTVSDLAEAVDGLLGLVGSLASVAKSGLDVLGHDASPSSVVGTPKVRRGGDDESAAAPYTQTPVAPTTCPSATSEPTSTRLAPEGNGSARGPELPCAEPFTGTDEADLRPELVRRAILHAYRGKA